eukprot:CAMPEP_0194377582 /NCGR_PEP_ID=MMETSP0174-20130528/31924_1 /TAXON_ID=216777 /ORGANISM="Proboscia alata, Strain PI-D3" /LENGTH=42 /DNA_ID= /DNA_START= /DNA_END= /DNA_ORIENTATION=
MNELELSLGCAPARPRSWNCNAEESWPVPRSDFWVMRFTLDA